MKLTISYIIFLAFIFTLVPFSEGAIEFAIDKNKPIALMWQFQKSAIDEDYNVLMRAGINTIQAFSLTRWNDKDISRYLDKASSYSLRVIIYLGNFLEQTGLSERRFNPACADFINKWKFHPAIFAWHIIDEPRQTMKRMNKHSQDKAYEFVKKIDPVRPVMVSINFTTQADYNRFFSENAFDIIDIHAYVNPNIDRRQQQLIKSFKKNSSGNYPVIVTLRSFNGHLGSIWKNLEADSLQKQYDFFITDSGVTKNVGFYGWKLSPNKGLKEDPELMSQFLKLRR